MEETREYVNPTQPSRSQRLLQEVMNMIMDPSPPAIPQFRRTVPLRHFTNKWQSASVKEVKLQRKSAARAAAQAAFRSSQGETFMTSVEIELVPAACTLYYLPRELRDQIYSLVLHRAWDGKTPTFLIALRGDKKLYREALNLFYRTNTFSLTKNNGWMTWYGPQSPTPTTLSAIKTITSLAIEMPRVKKDPLFVAKGNAEAIIIDCVAFIKAAKNVRTLELIFHSCKHHLLDPHLSDLICWFVNCSLIRTLRVTYSAASLFFNGHQICFNHGRINRRLGVMARPMTVPTNAPMTWQWETAGKRLGFDILFIEPNDLNGFYTIVLNLDIFFTMDNSDEGFEDHELVDDGLVGDELVDDELVDDELVEIELPVHSKSSGALKRLFLKFKARLALFHIDRRA